MGIQFAAIFVPDLRALGELTRATMISATIGITPPRNDPRVQHCCIISTTMLY